jgi:hypothetical protein
MRSIRRLRPIGRLRGARPGVSIGCAVLALGMLALAAPVDATAAVKAPSQANVPNIQQSSSQQSASAEKAGVSLESAASKAGDTARAVAMSLIGLALAIASIVLAFRRDFKEAAGVFAVGIVAVLLATPAGLSLLQNTVTSLFGS